MRSTRRTRRRNRSTKTSTRSAFVAAALAIVLGAPTAIAADRSIPSGRLDWESGAGKSYLIPALEIPGFIGLLNGFNRRIFDDSNDYDSDFDTIERNLRTAPDFDKDPFSVNQLGHPYQGSIYYGAARSAGLSYWESLAYTLYGSFLWETAGETTPPSLNDHVATGIGGTFVGEAMFRMASLLLEGGGGRPGFWRELGAAVLSPSTGFNRLVFGDRFDAVFPSRDPATFIRLRLGATLSEIDQSELHSPVRREEGTVDFSMVYGLPGKPGYRYTRPFDYFLFELTAVPNARTVRNAIENFTIRGLLLGAPYAHGDDYRGLWGLFGGYEYLSPQIFRVATTSLALGTVGQWWLTRTIALQGTLLAGAGFGAAGTVGERDERDYHYGVIPEALLGLRVIFGDLAMIEAQGRQYVVVGVGSGVGGSSGRLSTERAGHEWISRASVGLTVAVYGPHAIGVQYLVTTRDTTTPAVSDRHQSVQTVTIAYNFLGRKKFGAVEWRPAEVSR